MRSYQLYFILFNCVVQIREYLPDRLVIRALTALQDPRVLPDLPGLMELLVPPGPREMTGLPALPAPQVLLGPQALTERLVLPVPPEVRELPEVPVTQVLPAQKGLLGPPELTALQV